MSEELKKNIQEKASEVVSSMLELSKQTAVFDDMSEWKLYASSAIDNIEEESSDLRDLATKSLYEYESDRLVRNIRAIRYMILDKIDADKPEQYDTDYIKKRMCDWLNYLAKRIETNVISLLNT